MISRNASLFFMRRHARACASSASREQAVEMTIKHLRAHPGLLDHVLERGDDEVRQMVMSSTAAGTFRDADADGDGTISVAERKEYMARLTRYPNVGASPRGKLDDMAAPTWLQLRRHAVLQFLPFVAFGILDNGIMLAAGNIIEDNLGAAFGISTLMAAGLGNMFSDVIGVGSTGYIETGAGKVLADPAFSAAQARSDSARRIAVLAQMFGIALGCLIGVAPLLLMEEERTRQLRELYNSFDKNGDGKVSLKEFEKGLGRLGITLTRASLERIFAEIDEDADRAVSFDEFCSIADRWKELDAVNVTMAR